MVKDISVDSPLPSPGRFADTKLFLQATIMLDLTRLRPILKEFGEYPESYRSLIWKSILSLPENQAAYIALINKGIHPAFSSLDKEFPLTDKSLLSSVKR